MLKTVLQGFGLDCKRLRDAPASCNLVVYYNSTGNVAGSSDSTAVVGLSIQPPFGIPARQLPHPRPAWNSAQFNATETQLNRTESIYNSTLWPMLYFHGGRSCNLVLTTPLITGVRLQDAPHEASAVRVVGLRWGWRCTRLLPR
jgi:hypothetical protein